VDHHHSSDQPRPSERECELNRRYLAHERRKVLGLIVIALILLAIAIVRFGHTIPWNAR
jgi:hypothetical protein